MEKHTTVSLLSAVMAVLAAFDANAGVSLFSDYGQIQNVQKYSSNPFWTPNSPYNQRLPQPVYVQGADLNAGDCIKVVQSKVAVQCMARDNCRNTKLADIRPTIMIELSNLPGNNYVSACSGYIDSVFESYVQQYGSSLPNRGVAFPTATEPNQNLNDNGIQIKNPYQQTTPKWKSEYMERSNELAALQRENGAGTEHLEHNDFPATFNDLSFAARSQFANDDYAIYKDLDTYKGLKALDDEEWCNEHPTSKECIENEGTDCINEIPHATIAEMDANGQCTVQECQNGFKVSQDKLSCEPETGNCTPDATLANAKHAIEWNFDSNQKCVISKCEEGWQPETDGSACKDADVFYTLAFCFTPYEDSGEYYCARSSYIHGMNPHPINWCFPECGTGRNYNDGTVANALNNVLNIPTNKYCVPYIKNGTDHNPGNVKYKGNDPDKFSLINKDTKEQYRFITPVRLNNIMKAMGDASDAIPANQGRTKHCDGHDTDNIDALILKHDHGNVTIYHRTRIDD